MLCTSKKSLSIMYLLRNRWNSIHSDKLFACQLIIFFKKKGRKCLSVFFFGLRSKMLVTSHWQVFLLVSVWKKMESFFIFSLIFSILIKLFLKLTSKMLVSTLIFSFLPYAFANIEKQNACQWINFYRLCDIFSLIDKQNACQRFNFWLSAVYFC